MHLARHIEKLEGVNSALEEKYAVESLSTVVSVHALGKNPAVYLVI